MYAHFGMVSQHAAETLVSILLFLTLCIHHGSSWGGRIADVTTLALIPGLVSDGFVWAYLAEVAASKMPVHSADLSKGTSITGMAEQILKVLPKPKPEGFSHPFAGDDLFR
jgi:hypothetical protein